ncbi:MAG: 3-deoxy-7-phosphoheptulonate synthase [Dehalococcoidia bacterium]|nr:3-deoxy-7-phosphoheptulonate synthase [Dehalococcoidia bacterium]
MIIVMRRGAPEEEIAYVEERIREEGVESHRTEGVDLSIIGVIGSPPDGMLDRMELLPGVERVTPISKPYKLAAREFTATPTVIEVGDVAIGGAGVALMAGPCTVESREQLLAAARGVKATGAHLLRGGAFKPRSTPYSFQGLKDEGLDLLAEARAETGLPVVTEVMEPGKVPAVYEAADVFQIGARNCQNYPLLHEVGRTDKPVMLKRGPGCTIDEWIQAAEHVMDQGNMQVMLCERGIKSFETYTRYTLDMSAIPVVKRLTHLPVIVDPSHSTGKWYLVKAMSMAAIAAGADGLLIEVHPTPDTALCDGAQSLTIENFADLAASVQQIAQAVGRVPGALPDDAPVAAG